MVERTPLKDRARGHWKAILSQLLGIDSRTLDGKHHPCPLCGGKDRWRFDDLKNEGTSICGQCGSRSGVQLVMDKLSLDFQSAAIEIEKIIGTDGAVMQPKSSEGEDRTRKLIDGLRQRSERVTEDDPVRRYLARRVPGMRFVPSSLRLVRKAEYFDRDAGVVSSHPVMLATVSDMFGDAISVHRTFLKEDGSKADVPDPKRTLGPLPDGCAVRLAKVNDVVGIAEGIETALSAMAMHRIPVWAALNANRLEVWSPPEGVKQVVIFGDNDVSSTGQAAAFALSKRLESKGVITQVLIPPDPGTDWNDVFLSKGDVPA